MDESNTDAQMKEVERGKEASETMNASTQVENLNASSEALPLSQRLERITELMQSINQQLKDLSNEQKALVSEAQWTNFKTTTATASKPSKFWQKSLFARTYFVDKDLDESFQNVVKYCSMFYTHLNNLNCSYENFVIINLCVSIKIIQIF